MGGRAEPVSELWPQRSVRGSGVRLQPRSAVPRAPGQGGGRGRARGPTAGVRGPCLSRLPFLPLREGTRCVAPHFENGLRPRPALQRRIRDVPNVVALWDDQRSDAAASCARVAYTSGVSSFSANTPSCRAPTSSTPHRRRNHATKSHSADSDGLSPLWFCHLRQRRLDARAGMHLHVSLTRAFRAPCSIKQHPDRLLRRPKRGEPRGHRTARRVSIPCTQGLGELRGLQRCACRCAPPASTSADGLQYQCIGCAACVDVCN